MIKVSLGPDGRPDARLGGRLTLKLNYWGSSMKGRILCPIDFSESSIEALKCAIEIARKECMGITVLFSYRLIEMGQGEEIMNFKNKMEASAKERFSAIEHFFNNGVNIDYEFVIEIGFFSDCISRQIRTGTVAQIVIDNGMRPLLNDKHLNQMPFLYSLSIPVIVVGEAGPSRLILT